MPVLLYWALVQSFRPLRLTTAWLRVGHPTLPMWIAAATVAVGSAVSLLLWFKLARPDVKWPRGLLVPFVAHAVTDLSIFEILIYLAHD